MHNGRLEGVLPPGWGPREAHLYSVSSRLLKRARYQYVSMLGVSIGINWYQYSREFYRQPGGLGKLIYTVCSRAFFNVHELVQALEY